jgi:Protein of unknown function (DUF2924)
MKVNVSQELAILQRLTMRELRGKFADLFGETTLAGNRTWLVRRILWRMQALAQGDLSERARRRAAELANDADLRLVAPPPSQPPQPTTSATQSSSIPPAQSVQRSRNSLPPAGTVIGRVYKGQRLEVRVLTDGFEFQGSTYASLSAVAQAITGAHWNGRLFFGLNGKGGDR